MVRYVPVSTNSGYNIKIIDALRISIYLQLPMYITNFEGRVNTMIPLSIFVKFTINGKQCGPSVIVSDVPSPRAKQT